MRKISKTEQYQRGCRYCRFVAREKQDGQIFVVCPANQCPFHELDTVKLYTDYLKKYGKENMKQILVSLGMVGNTGKNRSKKKSEGEKPGRKKSKAKSL